MYLLFCLFVSVCPLGLILFICSCLHFSLLSFLFLSVKDGDELQNDADSGDGVMMKS